MMMMMNPREDRTLVSASFDAVLKKGVRWPLSSFRFVQPAISSSQSNETANADANAGSPSVMHTLVFLRQGRFVSGSADGTICVWDWYGTHRAGANTTGDSKGDLFETYGVTYRLQHAHKDIVKSVLALRCPDVFLSAGYDGKVDEWHIYDSPVGLCLKQNSLLFTHAPPTPANDTTSLSRRADEDMLPIAVGTCDAFGPANLLFGVGLFENYIRCYGLVPTYGCSLPDDYVFDGCKSSKLSN